jgi:hypothetical protein
MEYPKQSEYEYNAKDIIVDLCNEYDQYIEELENKHEEETEALTARIEELETK